MAESNESTRLLTNENKPQYVFNSSVARERKKKIKQFQCFLCGTFLCFLIIALVISIFFSLTMKFDDEQVNATAPFETLNLLLSQNWPLEDTRFSNISSYNMTEWENALSAGKEALLKREDTEKTISLLPVDSPGFRHQQVTSTAQKAIQLSRAGYIQEYGMKYMHRNTSESDIQKICLNETDNPLNEFCTLNRISCNHMSTYRSYDGSCNNLKNPGQFGVAFRPFRRSIRADYGDGISSPRLSKDGGSLPTARTVSLVVHRPYYRDDRKFTVMLAVWGQFLDHDITATALSKTSNGSSISCCHQESSSHSECFPVLVDEGDPLRVANVTCMEFVRSAPAPTCCLGPREQMNQVTAFIDGSVVYGVEKPFVEELRTKENGQLKMLVTKDNRTLLPVSENPRDGCNRDEAILKGEYCFEAGDLRSNENLHLTSMHTLWARHHNQIASNLSRINQHWNDERLFQETRKIIGAQMQHISYKEFLPILLGSELMTKLNLHPQNNGYFMDYNDTVDPSIANHFSTAAFRFAHTIIPGLMKLLANDSSSPEFIQMHKMLFNPFKLYQSGEMDKIVRGAMNTNIEASDPYFTIELKQHLFERDGGNSSTNSKRYGLDLVSLNIQRGRDHGLPGYVKWRRHCGLNTAANFDDLERDMDYESLSSIKSLYKYVEDIDLYTGALSEKPLNGSILGPTLTCLILDQFVRLKYGDRFWYETPERNIGFSPEQLQEIRKTSLAGIICTNSDNVTYSQSLVMEQVRTGNEIVHCSKIPGIDLNFWREKLDTIPFDGDQLEVRTFQSVL